MRHIPYSDSVEPHCAIARSETHEPKLAECNSDSEQPSNVML